MIEENEMNENLNLGCVIDSSVKLDWNDDPSPKKSDVTKVFSFADVDLPHTVGSANIRISEEIWTSKYEATLWCFNRGTHIGTWKTLEEAKENALIWWADLIKGMLNCR